MSEPKLCNEYVVPTTLRDALGWLAEYNGESQIIAGGTDLVLSIKGGRRKAPYLLIDISRIPDLRSISIDEEKISIGACVTMTELIHAHALVQKAPIIPLAARQIAGRQIRNVATAGGNVCNASPAADLVPALLVLNATAMIVNCEGNKREVPLVNFLLGVRKVDLQPKEILIGFRFNVPDVNAHTSFRKVQSRRAMAISIINQAIYVVLDRGVIREVRISMGSVAPTAVRLAHFEKALTGISVNDIDRVEIQGALRNDINPISDFRGSENYRILVAQRLLVHELSQLLKRPQQP